MENFETRRRKSILVFGVVLLLTISSCRNAEKNLVGDYKLFIMSGRETRIARPDRFVDHVPHPSVMLAGNVKQYAVRNPYITGYADTEYLDLSAEPDARTGYFLIDTKVDKILRYGMDELQWRQELDKIAWSNPKLKSIHTWF